MMSQVSGDVLVDALDPTQHRGRGIDALEPDPFEHEDGRKYGLDGNEVREKYLSHAVVGVDERLELLVRPS
jgi:hypothetical protein